MKLFLKQVLIFTSILLMYCGIMFFINLHYIHKPMPRIAKKRILIVGDSHARKGIDPALMPSAYNIALDAQPYCITYWTLQKVLKNYGCDTLIISFAYNNLSTMNDKKFIDKEWAAEMFDRIYTMVGLDSLKNIGYDRTEYYHTIFNHMLLYPKLHPVKYIGKYTPGKKNVISDYERVLQRHYYYNGKMTGISPNAIKYLNLIIGLCKKNGVTPILVTTPLHKFYRQRIPSKFVNSLDSLTAIYRKQNIAVLNFSAAPFSDKEFLNSDHLNVTGATRFTHMLDSVLYTPKNVQADTIHKIQVK